MSRAQGVDNLISGLVLIVGLALWVVLPLPAILMLLAMLFLWLRFTRNGQLSTASFRIGIGSLPQRWTASSVIVIGIAGVVAVLVAMLAMDEGFKTTLRNTGSSDSVIIMRGGSQSEVNSLILREQVPLISSLPGIRRDAEGWPLMSAELSVVGNMVSRGTDNFANAQFRGVNQGAWQIHDQVRIIEGRRFTPGTREIVVGQSAQAKFKGTDTGNTLTMFNQQWQVVGAFASGDAHDSEIWADTETLAAANARESYQSVTVRVDGASGLRLLTQAIDEDPRLKLEAQTTQAYYDKQSGQLSTLINILGKVVGIIMATGAVFGALNTMYATVASRASEIATMRAIGFRGLPVVMSVMMETMLLALTGGALGGFLAWLFFNGYSVSTLNSGFSQVIFQFNVTPYLLWVGLKWALGIGLIGGLFPALRAARLPIPEALRAI
ncbi:MAG: ABC transporter permease [Xanthomonadaceae bacterium]|jgi:putative ABC transport system permease protein|nr:ABC transporter permease [Xanthomonadaceae bacterium]